VANEPEGSWGEGHIPGSWGHADAHQNADKLFTNTWAASPGTTPPILAVTATRQGLTSAQQQMFISVVRNLVCDSFVFHHGAAIGGDAELAYLASGFRQQGKTIRIVAWPSNLASQRSSSAVLASDEVKPEMPPLERNVAMIAGADLLLAFPAGFEEEVRSGTWATIRAAERNGIRVTVVWPNGSLQWSNSWGPNRLNKSSGDEKFVTAQALEGLKSDNSTR